MKLAAKHKWQLVALCMVLSCVFMYFACVNVWVTGIILGYLWIAVSLVYSVMGLIHYKVFERFFAWLTTDDK